MAYKRGSKLKSKEMKTEISKTLTKEQAAVIDRSAGNMAQTRLKISCMLSFLHVSQGQGRARNGDEQQTHLSAAKGNEQPTGSKGLSVDSGYPRATSTPAWPRPVASNPAPPGPRNTERTKKKKRQPASIGLKEAGKYKIVCGKGGARSAAGPATREHGAARLAHLFRRAALIEAYKRDGTANQQ